MAFTRIYIAAALLALTFACSRPEIKQNPPVNNAPASSPTPKLEIADHFAYPIGEKEAATAKKDKDGWFNELEYGRDDSLGEHWTTDAGGESACGEPVYAAANGNVIYAEFAGPEWGIVMIIDHQLPSGERVQSLYGNLLDTTLESGAVKVRQEIGHVGNANGRYLCRLHFEVRTPESSAWNQPGPMNSADKTGWLDPSNFIDAHR
jgi:hypothetical protein